MKHRVVLAPNDPTNESLAGWPGDVDVTMVGAGRLASSMAAALMDEGYMRVTSIDPDVAESHSLDAMECYAAAIGEPKVQAVGELLASRHPRCRFRGLARPIEHRASIEACVHADLIVSAPDDNRARLVASAAATAALRPHLDLGTAVLEGGRMGADIRFVLPGACLLCVGGLDLDRPERRGDWRRERAGSLRSLNQLAVAQGLGLLRAYATGALRRPTWVRIEVSEMGVPECEVMPWLSDPDCPVCVSELGRGMATFESA